MKKVNKETCSTKNETGYVTRIFIDLILKYGIPTEVLIDDGVSLNKVNGKEKKLWKLYLMVI